MKVGVIKKNKATSSVNTFDLSTTFLYNLTFLITCLILFVVVAEENIY